MGAYASGSPKGIRTFPYSTDLTTNPHTYGYVRKMAYAGEHRKGEIWAAVLYEMLWNLMDRYGFGDVRDAAGKSGNAMALLLTVDGLKMQPCRPTFIDARDAILQADEVDYGGENACLLWTAFAKRGLGYKARHSGHEDFSLPLECQ